MQTKLNKITIEDITNTYHLPLLQLIHKAAEVHKQYFDPLSVQLCSLLSIKTGGCPEDCSYCSQSAHSKTSIKSENLKSIDDVLNTAQNAKEKGASRFCMGAAWRSIKENDDFENVLEMIKKIKSLNMEACCSLGMVTKEQAFKLKEAGLTSYNHNLDTGPKYYSKIISTRTYKERLTTLENIQNAGISVCCGAIIGLGENDKDRIEFIYTLANMPKPPESIPVNALIPVKGTPLENREKASIWDVIRMISVLRIFLPESIIRISAGRSNFTYAEQTLCFLSGANSIFLGDKLLTEPNANEDNDHEMMNILGINGGIVKKTE
ncbi:MAG: biotin synthase BioB [Spirochaetia bacterium]|nr:biotin synthase BioB [Spirochaetia bacterium]